MGRGQARHRMCRIIGTPICGSDKCPAIKRPYAPGQHGRKRNSHTLSEYGVQLLEKQKLKVIYGLRERQFHRYYVQATKDKHHLTGDALLQLMETRLDNLVYRLGFARTIQAARQLVVHGHITVDNHRVNRPSYCVPVGSVIRPTDRARHFKVIVDNINRGQSILPYLTFDSAEVSGTLLKRPARTDLPVSVNTTLVVEYYARS